MNNPSTKAAWKGSLVYIGTLGRKRYLPTAALLRIEGKADMANDLCIQKLEELVVTLSTHGENLKDVSLL